VKPDKMIRLLKTVPTIQVDFNQTGQIPVITNPSNVPVQMAGWQVVGTFQDTVSQSISLEWEDHIDISGIQAAELSLVNQGGAVTTCRPPTCTFPDLGSAVFVTYVSVNPIRGEFSERAFYGNSLSAPSESQDWFLATSQTYARDSTGAGFMQKISENNWGTGGIASSTRLFVKCFAFFSRAVLQVPPAAPGQPPTAGAFDGGTYSINMAPTTIGMMAVTAELNPVSTAAAIMRGNDLQQSYDNP